MNLNSFLAFLEKISKFGLEHLPKEWVNLVWSQGFPTPLEIPAEYELQVDVDYKLVRDTRDLLHRWLLEEEDLNTSGHGRESLTARKSWNSLGNELNHKALLCVLSAFVGQYDSTNSSDESVQLNRRAVEAARLYLLLISVNGSHIFQVFQSVLYHQCLEIFKAVVSSNKPEKVTAKGRGRKRNTTDDDDSQNGHDSGSVGNHVIIKECCKLIDDVQFSLARFSLKIDEGALNQTIQTMIQVAATERKEVVCLTRLPNKHSTTYLAFKAYSILESLCSAFHGSTTATLKDVMRHILPCLCIYDQQSWQQLSQDTVVIKNHSIAFVIKMITVYKEESYNPVSALVEQLCIKVPDKADIRTKYADIVINLVNKFPFELYTRTLLFLTSLCLSGVVRYRLLGVEIVAKIGNSPFGGNSLNDSTATNSAKTSLETKSSTSSTNSQGHNVVTFRFLFGLILTKCADISPRVRIKSLSILSSFLKSTNFSMYEVVEEIFVFNVNEERRDLFDFNHFFSEKLYNEPTIADPLPTAGTVIKLIERLTQDAKALVRKNALHVVSDICMIHNKWINEDRLTILVSACKDLSVGNRKLMAQCLTELLDHNNQHDLLMNAWVAGVVPLFAENEVKGQEKVLELARSIILDKIVPADKMSSGKDKLPWKIIGIISKRDLRKLFKYACQQWCLQNFIKDGLIKSLLTYVGTEYNLAAWYFLVCISEYQDLPNPDIILNYFYEHIYNHEQMDELESELVMQTLVLSWRKLKPSQIQELCENLKTSFEEYKIPLPLISGSLEIIQLNLKEELKDWAEPILSDCQKRMMQRVEKIKLEECYSDTLLCRLVFVLGELSLVCPDNVASETVSTLSNLIDLANIDDASLEKSLSNFGYVQAVTITTLGKLCLQNQFTAKAVVPILGALVSAKTPSAIKNNANIALTDLCIRFSSLVEPYFGDMFICLKDPDQVVRRNTLDLITMLIQEQFLKLKAHIFIYLISMLLDPSSEIRDFASSFIVNSLFTKDPTIVFTHFVQGIFFLNGYEGASRDQISKQERSVFCLIGEENKKARRELYLFLLQHMDDVSKFKTKNRICIEILNQIVEDKIKLKGPKGDEETGVVILKDSLYVLGCEEIKMTVKKGGKDGGPEDEEDDIPDPVKVAKKNVMSQLFSSITNKNLVEHIIPIFKNLKQKLDSEKSPLVGDVIDCLREILKEFSKEQIEDILAADPSLSAEVLHALRRHESEEGPSNHTQEESATQSSPQNVIMEQMAQVAQRLSCRVLLHGPDSITTDDAQVADIEEFVSKEENHSTPRKLLSSPGNFGRSSKSPLMSDSEKTDGISAPGNSVIDRRKVKAKRRSQRGDRSSSVTSDASDCSTSISSLSSYNSSSSGSTKSLRRKR